MSHPAFTLCIGPDATLLRDYITERLAAFPPAAGGEWKRRVFWGDAPLAEEFWQAVALRDLFEVPQAVILRRADLLALEQWKKISAVLARIGSHTWPFLCLETDFEKGRPKLPASIGKLKCCAFAREKGWVAEIPPLDADAKNALVRRHMASLGLRPAPAALDQILRLLPRDAGAIRLELEKLALSADPSGTPAPEALRMLGQEPDMDIFSFLRGLQHGRQPERVWIQYNKDKAASQDAGLFGFLAMLLREGRILWQILAGEPVVLPGGLLAAKTGLARSLGFNGLARIWDLALRADKSVKTGEQSPDQALEFLLAELFRLFAPKRASS